MIHLKSIIYRIYFPLFNISKRKFSVSSSSSKKEAQKVYIAGKEYYTDHFTNVTPHILSKVGRKLYLRDSHPLGHLCKRIIHYMYQRYVNSRGNPLFSVYDQIHPIVSVEQNFDSLMVPIDHISRQKRDNYYINTKYLLRGHTTAHQVELIKMGLDNALIIGDVFRRDEIDSSHYPVFHQADGIRLLSKHDVFGHFQDISSISLFEERPETDKNQSCHSDIAVKILTADLQECLLSLAISMFGNDLEYRWVNAYFPFTHPSWELEVKIEDKWTELLGCGIIRQEILHNCGIGKEKIGWAFGLGLERWAMKLYQIPDVRLFWSDDVRFASQFSFEDPYINVRFQPFSKQPPLINDISFWLPPNDELEKEDFYDLVRSVGRDLVEKVELLDCFVHPKRRQTSHCYRITYRSWERPLNQQEVTEIHKCIEQEATQKYHVTIR